MLHEYHATISEDLQSAFETPAGGVVGLVDDLLRLCPEHGLLLDWHDDHCRVRSLAKGSEEVLALPMRRSIFRAMLARLAALCNEQIADSVSPYGGQGELTVGADQSTVFKLKFTNTTSEQNIEITSASR